MEALANSMWVSQFTRFYTEGFVSQEYVRSHRFVMAVPLSGDGALDSDQAVRHVRSGWFIGPRSAVLSAPIAVC